VFKSCQHINFTYKVQETWLQILAISGSVHYTYLMFFAYTI